MRIASRLPDKTPASILAPPGLIVAVVVYFLFALVLAA
jgi:hypothetical protein